MLSFLVTLLLFSTLFRVILFFVGRQQFVGCFGRMAFLRDFVIIFRVYRFIRLIILSSIPVYLILKDRN